VSDEHRGLQIIYKGWIPGAGYVFVNVRFGSLAALFGKFSLMSAFGRKADVPLLFFAEKISEKSLLKMRDHDKHPYDDILKSEVCPPTLG